MTLKEGSLHVSHVEVHRVDTETTMSWGQVVFHMQNIDHMGNPSPKTGRT